MKAGTTKGAVTFYQCDRSFWAVSIAGLETKYVQELGMPEVGFIRPDELIAFAETLYWREVMHLAVMLEDPIFSCPPDYNYGWQHADKTYDFEFNSVAYGVDVAVEAAMARQREQKKAGIAPYASWHI